MRKLLFLSPLLLASVNAAPVSAPKELTATLTVPEGAKSMVVHFTGKSEAVAIFSNTRQLVIHLTATPGKVSFAWRQENGNNITSSKSVYKRKFTFTPTPAAKKTIKVPLNTWTPLWAAENQAGWTFTLGSGKKVKTEPVVLNVLFSTKQAERISNDLQPPQKP